MLSWPSSPRRSRSFGAMPPTCPSRGTSASVTPPARSWRSSTTTPCRTRGGSMTSCPPSTTPRSRQPAGRSTTTTAACSRRMPSPTRTAKHRSRPTVRTLRRLVAAPCSDLIVTPIGTNSAFRRSALVGVGGFDEEFSHYFDETEVCRRLVDKGWVVEACERGFVQHLRSASAVRTHDRVTRDIYPLLKSRLYFALRHALPRHGLLEVDATLRADRRALPR